MHTTCGARTGTVCVHEFSMMFAINGHPTVSNSDAVTVISNHNRPHRDEKKCTRVTGVSYRTREGETDHPRTSLRVVCECCSNSLRRRVDVASFVYITRSGCMPHDPIGMLGRLYHFLLIAYFFAVVLYDRGRALLACLTPSRMHRAWYILR